MDLLQLRTIYDKLPEDAQDALTYRKDCSDGWSAAVEAMWELICDGKTLFESYELCADQLKNEVADQKAHALQMWFI